jgi:hypothetical protein
MDIKFQIPTNKDKLCQGTQWGPQEHPERKNPAINHREFHEDITRNDQ